MHEPNMSRDHKDREVPDYTLTYGWFCSAINLPLCSTILAYICPVENNWLRWRRDHYAIVLAV
jgi:hypothetical protein